MPSYKLKYFTTRAFEVVPRLLFALSGQEYEDIPFTKLGTWPAEKPNTPFGRMPVLEIDDKYGQSSAISRYLARTFGFYGKDDIEALQVDQVLGIIEDLVYFLTKAFYEKDEARKAEFMKEAKDKVPFFIGMLEKVLKDNGSTGYCVGDKISLADVAVFDLYDKVKVMIDFPMDTFPLVKKSVDMVGANPKIKHV